MKLVEMMNEEEAEMMRGLTPLARILYKKKKKAEAAKNK